jgi:hypothetical protein
MHVPEVKPKIVLAAPYEYSGLAPSLSRQPGYIALFWPLGGGILIILVTSQTRLKSSFIYLANAVSDLRSNWQTFAVVLAPLALLGALCLLPDALNLQHQLAEKFTPGIHNIGWWVVQEPYAPAAEAATVLPSWMLMVFHLLVLILAFGANLVVLCTLRRDRAGIKHERLVDEAIAIYEEAGRLAPGFYWIVFLQVLVPLIALALLRVDFAVSDARVLVLIYTVEIALTVFAALVYLWLYFARYALVFEGRRSFHGLLFSRDLMRKRFFRVATRIVVFLAVWSGYNSWAAAAFVFVSVVLGPVGALTGYLWATIFTLDVVIAAITYVTAAFFTAAGVRLYQDVTETAAVVAQDVDASIVTARAEPVGVSG